MRTFGLVAGFSVVVVIAVLVIGAVLALSNETAWIELDAGDCLDLAAAIDDADGDLAAVTTVDPIDCERPHDAEVVAVGELTAEGDRPYPDDDELFAEIDAACHVLVPDSVDPGTYGIVPVAPDERTWQERSGRFACVAVVVGGGTVTGSALG